MSIVTAKTDGKQKKPLPHWFKPGQSGNPKGRPKGSRERLGRVFVESLSKDFEKHGEEVIERVREEQPAQYLKTVASILPRIIDVKMTSVEEMSDADLLKLIAGISGRLGAAGPCLPGTGQAGEVQQAAELPAISEAEGVSPAGE